MKVSLLVDKEHRIVRVTPTPEWDDHLPHIEVDDISDIELVDDRYIDGVLIKNAVSEEDARRKYLEYWIGFHKGELSKLEAELADLSGK